MSDTRRRIEDSAKLKEILLISCELDVSEDLRNTKGKINISMSMNADFIDESIPKMVGHINTTIHGESLDEPSSETKKTEFFTLKIRQDAIYELPGFDKESISNEQMDSFVRRFMVLHVWPYTKDLVLHLTHRAPMPNIVLPFLPNDHFFSID